MSRSYYSRPIEEFIAEDRDSVLGKLADGSEFAIEQQQRDAWVEQIRILKEQLRGLQGHVFLEFSIPRMGRRADCVLLLGATIIVIEFKVGAVAYEGHAVNQVLDYALDLKNFHEGSHSKTIVPLLVATCAPSTENDAIRDTDGLYRPLYSNGNDLALLLRSFSGADQGAPLDAVAWEGSIYKPTPTIIEAAQALYSGHRVEDISRSDSGAINLTRTSNAISEIIRRSKERSEKAICFLTGVPGAGKTLAGLNLANGWHNLAEAEHAVFLSGNGPLVDVLREALARDEVSLGDQRGVPVRKGEALTKARAFIQNIHHFRDDALENDKAPVERVVVFDEAQRAWTREQTAKFMREKKRRPNFTMSEPEFLISVMDRHTDWATIVCLVGGGQEINTGEAGLPEWFNALKSRFPHWSVYLSETLRDHEYTRGARLPSREELPSLEFVTDLHLAVSVRSFRSEKVSALVKAILDLDAVLARRLCNEVSPSYPIAVTRSLDTAKRWVRQKARGNERYGLLASSGAMRLRPWGIHVKSEPDARHWFLNERDDVRSSYCLEEVATEFMIQGLELDWTVVAWDADLRYEGDRWDLKSFRGSAWQEVNDADRRLYLLNAYRVLLTRARQGMVIFVPHGDPQDPTRSPQFYDQTYAYLREIGLPEVVE